MANTNKKQYTFLNVVNATSKGNTFKNMVIKGYVSRIQEGEANGKKLIRATVACSGRTKIINSMFGTNIPEDNVVWINVTVWEERAERFKHMLEAIGNPNTVNLVLIGSASVNKYTNKNGEEVEGINLSVNDWTLCGGNTGSNRQQVHRHKHHKHQPKRQMEMNLVMDSTLMILEILMMPKIHSLN